MFRDLKISEERAAYITKQRKVSSLLCGLMINPDFKRQLPSDTRPLEDLAAEAKQEILAKLEEILPSPTTMQVAGGNLWIRTTDLMASNRRFDKNLSFYLF